MKVGTVDGLLILLCLVAGAWAAALAFVLLWLGDLAGGCKALAFALAFLALVLWHRSRVRRGLR